MLQRQRRIWELGIEWMRGKMRMCCHTGKGHKVTSRWMNINFRWTTFMITVEFADHVAFLLRCQIKPILTWLFQDMHTRDQGIFTKAKGFTTEQRCVEQINFAEVAWDKDNSHNLSQHVCSYTNNLSFFVFALFPCTAPQLIDSLSWFQIFSSMSLKTSNLS